MSEEVKMKRCTKCGEMHPATLEYFLARGDSDGLRAHCKYCRLLPKVEKTTKRCSKCGFECELTRVAEFFGRHKYTKDGFSSHCKRCKAEAARAYAKKYPDKMRERWKRWRDNNPEKAEAIIRRYHENNAERVRELNKQWRRENPEKTREYVRNWRNKNLYQARAKRQVRRARENGLPDAFTADDWRRALEYWDHRCAICGKTADMWTVLAQDHWIPVSHPDCPGTVPTNIVPLCHAKKGNPKGHICCNNSKHKNHPDEWLVERFGKREANKIATRIMAYFEYVNSLNNDETPP